ncbi:Predicted arabinose efflux permease, MFS family [Halomicrobium zhouii]|uniref:Predicted arabinose efflux permease, MFS family n=1 Tax=Halomicrobium zhouii TaxID=767519 RepID=A0A1I6KTK0_9EURY|nr:MFS transporter [Halomicrobium zhouii]SFR94521.1 Predicted arabinose efflux permease, MFS family [Halomicrobium zhouii]
MVDSSVRVGRHLRDVVQPGTAIPWGSPTLRVVLVSTLLAPLGVAFISPGLPVIQDRFALTDSQTSLVISLYFVTGIVLSPVIGLIEDRIGRRRVLVPCLVGFSLSGASIAIAPSYEGVLVLRVVQGTAAAGIFVTTVTVIGDTFDGAQRSAVLGANTAVLSASAAVFPIFGGMLATVSWNVPFVAYLLGLPIALYAHRSLEEPSYDHATGLFGSIREAVFALSAREAALLYGSAFTIELLLFGTVFTAIPFLLAVAYGLAPTAIGLVVTAALAASAVSASQAGRLTTYFSDDAIIVLGFAGAGAGLVGTWLAGSPIAIGLASTVFGAGWGVVLPSIDDEVTEFVPPEVRGEALSLRNSTTFLGRTLAPVLFATLSVTWGYRVILLFAGIVGFIAGVIGWVLSSTGGAD